MDPFPSSAAPYGVTLLRVGLGVMWVADALLKLLVFTLPGTAQFFAGIGLPVLLIVASLSLWLLGDGAAALRRSGWLVPRLRAA